MLHSVGTFLKGVLIPILNDNPLVSCFLDKSLIFFLPNPARFEIRKVLTFHYFVAMYFFCPLYNLMTLFHNVYLFILIVLKI